MALERGFSADDLSLMLKLQGGAGFPRTDSEAAFMDFLKRIPSTSNLAAQASAQGLDAAQQQQLMQQAQQMQAQAQQSGLASSSSLTAPLQGTLQEVGRLNVGGIPRVPSLDLLRQLVQVNQSMSPNAAKAAASAPGEHPYCVQASSLESAQFMRAWVLRRERAPGHCCCHLSGLASACGSCPADARHSADGGDDAAARACCPSLGGFAAQQGAERAECPVHGFRVRRRMHERGADQGGDSPGAPVRRPDFAFGWSRRESDSRGTRPFLLWNAGCCPTGSLQEGPGGGSRST